MRYFFEYPEIIVELLPKYASELKPDGYCHSNVKKRAANATPDDRVQLRCFLDRRFARLRRRPDLLLGLMHAAGLPVKQLSLT